MDLQQFKDETLLKLKNSPFEKALGLIVRDICIIAGLEYGEVWMHDMKKEFLLHSSSYNNSTPEIAFYQKFSKLCKFSSGVGLIGKALESGKLEIMLDITENHDFVRDEAAKHSGLTAGYAFPVFSVNQNSVLAFFVKKHHDENLIKLKGLINILEETGIKK